jgi:hypothetical protein
MSSFVFLPASLNQSRIDVVSLGRSGFWTIGVVKTSLLGTFVLGGMGALVTPPAHAAFSGICPVLGATQPPYPVKFGSFVHLLPASITVPQKPVKVTVEDKVYPICAVYMSINQSNTKVADAIDRRPNSSTVPNDILFPNLTEQPWFGKGGDAANDFAEALIENGVWTIGGTDYSFSNSANTTPNQNLSIGAILEVNPKVAGNRNDSNPVPFFLWKVPTSGNAAGNARQVFVEKDGREYKWDSQNVANLNKATPYWYWVLDGPSADVPGPLPLFGAGAAYGWSRRLRQRIRQGN